VVIAWFRLNRASKFSEAWCVMIDCHRSKRATIAGLSLLLAHLGLSLWCLGVFARPYEGLGSNAFGWMVSGPATFLAWGAWKMWLSSTLTCGALVVWAYRVRRQRRAVLLGALVQVWGLCGFASWTMGV
jgi:hypothetical protein